MVARTFGTPLNTKVPKEPTAYKNKVPRGEEPCGPHTGFDCSMEYANTYVRDEHNSEFERKTWSPNPSKGSHWEQVDGNGNGFIRGPDSSKLTFINGTDNRHGKNGAICTYNSNMDSACYGGKRSNVGTDGQAGGKHLGKRQGGGESKHVFGYRDRYAAMSTEATTTASGRTTSNIGKYTINAEGGIGFGVNKGSSMKCFMRMEPTGELHVQVTPAGTQGGNMELIVSPNGNIKLTSVKDCTFEIDGTTTFQSKQGMNIKTPTLAITGAHSGTCNITHDGNYKQNGNYNLTGNSRQDGNSSQNGRHRDSLGTNRPS